ncbi:VanW family protein [Sulfurovum sp. bin170]|uniref:VanW family protein n=1 Tax=Sulfurovum sp. bin170 TaxID=2695268 RepID=UPI0013DFBA55|nr:VanW family protein [Sulfurovum sp. bin170]NEW61041.1 VanW family protein [Sulfurovum sp. bin170]
MIKRPKFISKPLSMYHPKLLHLAIMLKVWNKKLDMLFDGYRYATTRELEPFSYRIKKHKSLLLRKLGSCDMYLQHNKVKNLQIVVASLNGTVIQPDEVFSYFKLLGKPTKKRGFKEGIQLSNGEAIKATAGGICQSSNLIYWLALHTPLEIIERHHHSFDPFPDEGRVLPFASGATVMYNYLDLRLRNSTKYPIQLLLHIDDTFLYGEFRINNELKQSYRVVEENHFFEKVGDTYFRSNKLYRKIIDKRTGKSIKKEFIVRNYSEVMYPPNEERLNAEFSGVSSYKR